ncbi:MAG: hypothetical protein ACOYXO_15770 [Chloroflexota bacterium]
MFYVIVALWALGCVACWLLRRVQKKVLTVTCVAVPAAGAFISWILMKSHVNGAAIATLLLSIYLFIVLISVLITYRTNQHTANQ